MSEGQRALDELYENFLHECMDFKWDCVDSRIAVKQMKVIRDTLLSAFKLGRKDEANE